MSSKNCCPKIPIGSIEIPTSIVDMINGKGQFVILNHFYKDKINTDIAYTDSQIFEDKPVVSNSKATINITGINLLYKKPQNGIYTSNFAFILSNSIEPNESEKFTFKSPYTESMKRKKTLECKCSDAEISNKLLRFENILMYTLDFLMLAEFLDIPKDAIISANNDRELITNLFNSIYSENDKSKNIPYKYFSERYFDCIINPPVWIKEDKKFHIYPTEDELDGMDRVKYCTLSEVLYKYIPDIKKKELTKKHPRIYKYWFSLKQLIIPQTKKILYEKKLSEAQSRSGDSPQLSEYLSNNIKFLIKFDNTSENEAKGLYVKNIPDKFYIKFVTKENDNKIMKYLDFNDYLKLYGGSIDYKDGEQVTLSSQTWSGKIAFKLEFTTMLFSIGYPKIDANVRCLVINKSELLEDDDFGDLIAEAESNETHIEQPKKDDEIENDDIDADEY